MLAEGDSTRSSPRAPLRPFASRPGTVKRLFPDYMDVEKQYFRKTKIFPIMHTVVIRRHLREESVGRAIALQGVRRRQGEGPGAYDQTAALPAMLPWLVAHVEDTKREMGNDWWPYGLDANRTSRQLPALPLRAGPVEETPRAQELFARETLESFRSERRVPSAGLMSRSLDEIVRVLQAVKDRHNLVMTYLPRGKFQALLRMWTRAAGA